MTGCVQVARLQLDYKVGTHAGNSLEIRYTSICVMLVQLNGGNRMCGMSWLAVKDSLTHHPSS